jgi:hypothetical protein
VLFAQVALVVCLSANNFNDKARRMKLLLVNFGRDAVVAHAGLKKDQQQNGDHQKGLFKTN